MDPTPLLRASAVAVLLAGGLTTGVCAQRDGRERETFEYGPNCKNETIRASGNAVWQPFSRKREIDGEGAAFANAVVNWRREVRAKYGELWMQYERARGKEGHGVGRADFDCQPASSGVFGKNVIRCTISGDPCAQRAETGIALGLPGSSPGCRFERGDVKQAQRWLNSCRRECDSDVDGMLREVTVKCLSDFQRRFNLRISGEPCDPTLQALQRNCGGGRYRDR